MKRPLNIEYKDLTGEDILQHVKDHPDKVNARDRRGDIILSVAASKGDPPLVSLLLGSEDIDVNGQTIFGRTALFTASPPSIVSDLLEKGTDPRLPDMSGWTPLMWHTFKGNKFHVRSLLENPRAVEGINAQATNPLWEGDSALHIACKAHLFKES